MSRSLTDRVSESLLGVSAGGRVAVALGAVTVLRFFLVLVFFVPFFLVDEVLDVLFAVELLAADFFFFDFFLLAFFLAAETSVISKNSVLSMSGRPNQSHTPKD
ncbi:MAG: hypothetical protein K2L11_03185, partial [Muribaculaceae bacterium]|nr:hypothetical protein [Muribaculaceae bacterium]